MSLPIARTSIVCSAALLIACGTSKPQQNDRAAESFAGTSWQLVQFEGGDGAKVVPDDKSKYTIAFVSENEITVRKQWPYIRSYVVRDDHLFLALMADGGIFEFEPTKLAP